MSLLVVFADATAVFLMAVLLVAGVHKLIPANQNYYRGVLEGYGLPYHSQLNLASLVLGVVEVFTAVAIVVPVSRPLGALLAIVLFAIYFTAMSMQLLQGKRDLDCGCAGPLGNSTISPALLIRNALLIAMASYCLLGHGSLLSHATTAALTLPFVLLALIMYACAEQLIANGQKLKLLQHRGP